MNDISFTVACTDLKKAVPVVKGVSKELGGTGVLVDENVAKVAIVGVGMRSHAGVAARMFQALADKSVNIEMISTSEIKVSCIVNESDCQKAVQTLHKAFGLASKLK